MTTETVAAIVGATVGSLGAGLVSWVLLFRQDRAQRKALATAVLGEVYYLTLSMADLRDNWVRGRVSVVFTTFCLDNIVPYLHLFPATTVQHLLELRGSIEDIRAALRGLEMSNVQFAVQAQIVKSAKEVADSAIAKCLLVRYDLENLDALAPRIDRFPSRLESNAHLDYVRKILKP